MIARLLVLACALPIPAAAQSCDSLAPFADRPGASAGELAALREIPLLSPDDREVRLGELIGGAEVLVLCYTGVGCPISQKYAPRLTRLSESYAEWGARFLGINANPQDSRAAIERERDELALGFPIFKDSRQELTRALAARTMTEVFVFDRAGKRAYRGAIDDQYSLGAARPEPTRNYLVQALEAVLASEEPPCAETEPQGCLLTLLDDAEPTTSTWSRDIAPIVQRRCEACHRPDQVGPFSLRTYEDVKGRSKMIASVIAEGRMPPWNADARYDGVFANQRSLPAKEREAILSWIEGGMQRGNPAEDPPPKSWPEGWSIGEPDVVIAMERVMDDGELLPDKGYAVPREGVVEYQYFTAKTDYPEDRWIRSIEVRPGASDVVHHVLVLLDDPADPNASIDFRTYLAVAVPGDTPSAYPEGYGKRLPAGATIIFQLHYTPNGKERFDRSSLAIRFCDEPPEFEVVTGAVVNDAFEIPPGVKNHEVRSEVTIREDTGLVALFPHMHTRGLDFRYVAHYPDGNEEELLFSHYDFNWQESYLLPDPRFLPAGTRLECIGHFDNSADNPNNPDPLATVTWGEQTFEEMFIGYFDTVKPVE